MESNHIFNHPAAAWLFFLLFGCLFVDYSLLLSLSPMIGRTKSGHGTAYPIRAGAALREPITAGAAQHDPCHAVMPQL
jgi:hypothetical protein